MDQTVLIAPIGWERDRASLLALDLRVHRTYLLYQPAFLDTKRYADTISNDLEDKDVEVIRKELVGPQITREFDWLLFNIAKIIVDEHTKKNTIYINMSSSNKIAAAAATIAAMFHREKIKNLIYVVPSNYSIRTENPSISFREHGLGIGMSGCQYLPLFYLERPSEPILKIIVELYEKGPMKYGHLLQELSRIRGSGFESVEIPPITDPIRRKRAISKWTVRLRRDILDPVDQLYLETVPSHEGPEKKVQLTMDGQQLAILSGMASTLKLIQGDIR